MSLMRLREVLDLIHVGPPQQYPRSDRPFTENNCTQFHPGEPLLFALNHHVCIFVPLYGLQALTAILILISDVPFKSNRFVFAVFRVEESSFSAQPAEQSLHLAPNVRASEFRPVTYRYAIPLGIQYVSRRRF